MRTLLLISACFLLISCTAAKKDTPDNQGAGHRPESPLRGGNEGSPIVIADSSTHIRFFKPYTYQHFRVLGPNDAFIKLRNYQFFKLGFICGVVSDCSAAASPCASATPTTACYVDLNPSPSTGVATPVSSWKLALCETNSPPSATATCSSPTVSLTWAGPTDVERVDVSSHVNPFAFKKADAAVPVGAELQHSSGTGFHLTVATLTVAGGGNPGTGTYNFVNPSGLLLTLDYRCYVTGDATCGN